MNVPWTPEEEDLLKVMARAGLSDPQIAARLGRTAKAVRNKRRWLHIGKRPYVPPVRACARDVPDHLKPRLRLFVWALRRGLPVERLHAHWSAMRRIA